MQTKRKRLAPIRSFLFFHRDLPISDGHCDDDDNDFSELSKVFNLVVWSASSSLSVWTNLTIFDNFEQIWQFWTILDNFEF